MIKEFRSEFFSSWKAIYFYRSLLIFYFMYLMHMHGDPSEQEKVSIDCRLRF